MGAIPIGASMTGSKVILITGGCGFIGSHFVRMFLKKHSDFKIVNLDKLTYAGNPENLKDIVSDKELTKRYKFVKGDIADEKTVETVFKKFKPEFVVNFAAESHVDRSIHGYARDFVDTNVYGVFNLLETTKKFGVKKFVQISTDECYGSLPLDSPDFVSDKVGTTTSRILDFSTKSERFGKNRDKSKFTEASPYNPRSPYSASKAAGDLLCHSYFITYNLPVVVTHSSNNYGSYQYPEKLIPFFALRALKGEALPLYGDGKNVRDWIHVLDNVETIEKVLFKGKLGEIYNIGGDNELPNFVIAKKILIALKKPETLIKYVPDRPGHDRRYALDSSKIQKELSWKPKHNFDKMLAETVEWYRHNPAWVKGAVRRLKKAESRTVRSNRSGTGINPHIDL